MADFWQELQQAKHAGLDRSALWHHFLRYLHTLPEADIKSRLVELEAFAGDFPDEERDVGRHQYSDLTELEGDPREGPEWRFDNYKAIPGPLWPLARSAYHSFYDKVEPWLNFEQREQITCWRFDRYSSLPAERVAEVLSENFMTQSKGLSLSWISPASPAHLKPLLNRTAWQHWEFLALEWLRGDDGTPITPWFAIFAECHLKRLRLAYSTMRTEDFTRLAQHAFWESLEELTLHNVYLGDADARALLQAPRPGKLRRIKLSDSNLWNGGRGEMTSATWKLFREHGWFDHLEDFDMEYHELGPAGIRELSASPARKSLKRLRLQNARIGDEGFQALLDHEWPALKDLSIGYDSISPETLERFQRSALHAQCVFVGIYDVKAPSLFKAPEWKHL